ncbi:hypothetical protein BON30_46005 [Cystobacter ferrugineus]|uniref:Immunity MXAN-0049 protein domain-containing protein n=2 Tax=Cystobacter ferrugineus TaxID=83449 RepID=A0A1L9AVF9_9BACT|nr:DUF1629 domain-containing protein [Cystobacter ferrugineus]OJH34005.1 hypothetical protein BON30_46005 [Cystobacter ferrugineus]
MERRFFRLGIDVYVAGRWYLGEPTHLTGQALDDVWEFCHGRPVEVRERLRVPIDRPGKPLDFDTAGVGQAPIANARVASVFREMAPNDVQLFPIEVQGREETYYLVNVARTVRCIDDKASAEVQFYGAEDGWTERSGEYRSVIGLRIDKSTVGDARVFRPWGWPPPVIVDEEIKEALERTGMVGGQFDEV